jgi:signal transduction histidine kinase
MNMKSPFGIRLGILIAAILIVAGGTICGLSLAWRRVQEVESKLTTSQIQRFQFAGDVRRDLQSLNNSLLTYVLARDPGQWAHFVQASRELDQWIDQHDPSLNPNSELKTEAESKAIQTLNHAYDDYIISAQSVYTNAQPAMVSPHQLAQLDGFNAQANRMRECVRELTEAHRLAEEAFLANATHSLSSLRFLLMGAVVILLGLVAVTGWVIYRDMIAPLRTKLVQSQLLLEHQEKLATLGTLAAGIAHEIRNPLTSLKARLYTLEKHLQVVPAARKDTDIISAEISRLERIVQDVLKFARPADPTMEVIATDTLLHEVHSLMAATLKGQTVQLVVDAKSGLLVRADGSHLKQVLINLVRNAAESIDGTGTVTLRSRAARAFLNGKDAEVAVLEVCDTGRGIPPDAQKRLFDPFFSTKETGTGLGLPIANRIVEKHGGLIQYRTQPGFGTTFGVVLPREIDNASPGAKRRENPAH